MSEVTLNSEFDIYDTEDLVKMVRELFNLWGLTDEERSLILPSIVFGAQGVKIDSSKSDQFAEDARQRIIALLQIHACLRTLVAQPRELAYSWIKKKK